MGVMTYYYGHDSNKFHDVELYFSHFLRKIVVQRYGNVTDFENSQEIFSKKEKKYL